MTRGSRPRTSKTMQFSVYLNLNQIKQDKTNNFLAFQVYFYKNMKDKRKCSHPTTWLGAIFSNRLKCLACVCTGSKKIVV